MKLFPKIMLLLMLAWSAAAQAEDQLAAVRYIEGRWSVATAFYENEKWGAPAVPARAVADGMLGGAFIRLNSPIAFPGATFLFEMTLSYDKFNNMYRLAFLDDINGYMDIYTGAMVNGVLTANNAQTGTAFPDGNGGIVIGKLELRRMDKGFQFMTYIGNGKDTAFTPYMKLDFTPVE